MKLDRLSVQMKNLQPVYKSLGLTALNWILYNYKSGGAKLSTGKWKKLRPLTVQSRRKGSDLPLQDTGHLKRQWSSAVYANGVRIGNPSDVALFHEEGTKPYDIKPKNRSFLWFGVQPSQRWTGQKLGGHLAPVTDRVKGFGRKGTPGIFARIVHHPGLPVRRQLPREAEILPELIKTADVWMKKKIGETGLG